MKGTVIQMLTACALACATVFSTLHCNFIFHQEKEPESVRKLRKF